MTLKELRSCTCKELGTLAKRHQIAGWSSMRKDDLVKAIRKVTRSRKGTNGKASRPRSDSPAATTRQSTKRNGNPAVPPLPSNGAASAPMAEAKPDVDSIKVRAIDAQWLHVQWSISASMRARAQVALDTDWHRSQLVIRTMDVTDDDMRRGAHVCVGDVVVDKRAGSWCVRVDDPQRSYRLQVGYLSPAGRFFSLVRSRLIQTGRRNGQAAHVDPSATGTPGSQPSGGLRRFLIANAGKGGGACRDFPFAVGAELVVRGEVAPDSQVTVLNAPVARNEDGSFSVAVELGTGRQIIPAVAVAPDGRSQRTIVLAVECNVKELDTHVFDEQ